MPLSSLIDDETVLIYPEQIITYREMKKSPGYLLLHETFVAKLVDEWYQVALVGDGLYDVYGTVWWQESSEKRGPLTCIDRKIQISVLYETTQTGLHITAIHYITADTRDTAAVFPEFQTDTLTGLYNRDSLIQKIQGLLDQNFRLSAFFMLDIDNFKEINDTFGHRAGDYVISQTAERLKQVFRAIDIKGRIGGDEFIVFMANVSDRPSVTERVELLYRVFQQKIVFENMEIKATCSTGIVFCDTPDMVFDKLYKFADSAMYEAKAKNKNRYIIYDPEKDGVKEPEKKTFRTRKKRLLHHLERGRMALKKQDRSFLAVSAAGIFLLLGVFFFSSAQYLFYIKGMLRRDTKNSLEELGKHISLSLNTDIQNTKNILENIRLTLRQFSLPSEKETVDFLKEQAIYWNFSDVALIDSDGVWHHIDGSRDIPYNRALLARSLKENALVYDFQMIGTEDCIVFVIPIDNVSAAEQKYLAVSATYAVRNWDKLINIEVYDGQADTYITTRSGVTITRSLKKQERQYYNFLESLSGTVFEESVTFETLKNDIYNGQNVQVVYTKDHEEYYLVSTPVGFNDWTLMFTVPTAGTNNSGNIMIMQMIIICALLTLSFVFIFIFFQLHQRRTRKKLWNMAYTDNVTKGANKNRFEMEAAALLNDNGRTYVLVYMNICQFKLFNNRFGKEEADRILSVLQNGITEMLTPWECCGRLNADNFGLLLEQSERNPVRRRIEEFVSKHTLFNMPGGVIYNLQFSFGFYPVNDPEEGMTQMIDRANFARQTIPPGSEKLWVVYDTSMMEKATRAKELTENLAKAVADNEFYVCLQPKVSLKSRRITGAEALARWDNPRFGTVSPGEFVPLAEKAGFIHKIDWYVFEQVCSILDRWQREKKPMPVISFNLSKTQLDIPDFLDHYLNIFSRYRIPHDRLEFEFTESLLYEDTDVLKQTISEIHKIGFRCSMDDFGFGYSSLGLLGQFEADSLKLDRSFFLLDADPDSRNNRVVKSSILLAKELGMETVAEGIEDMEHVTMLEQFGCDMVQGYIFSKPVVPEKFEQLIQAEIYREYSR